MRLETVSSPNRETLTAVGLKLRHHKSKNTLLTYKIGDILFFGISRCNLDHEDKFSRKIGRSISAGRMFCAIKNKSDVKDFILGPSDLWGSCPAPNLTKLLKHFYNIDQIVDEKRKSIYKPRRKAA